MEKENIILEKSIQFSLDIIEFCDELNQKGKYMIAKQLLRSATSIGANIFEAQHPESKADFIHKMKIAIKEANETLYWLILCEKSKGYPYRSSLKSNVEELIRILSKIIITSKM